MLVWNPKRLQGLMEIRGFDAAELARRLKLMGHGTTRPTVTAWLDGTEPRASTLFDIAALLSVRDVRHFFTLTARRAPRPATAGV